MVKGMHDTPPPKTVIRHGSYPIPQRCATAETSVERSQMVTLEALSTDAIPYTIIQTALMTTRERQACLPTSSTPAIQNNRQEI